MERRDFITASLATVGIPVIAGCTSSQEPTNTAQRSLPTYDLPLYSNWIPAESAAPETGVVFTHIDWQMFNELDDTEDSGANNETGGEIAAVTEQVPIFGLPMYGAVLSPLLVFGIFSYPFAGDIVPEEGNQSIEGIETESMTWTENLLVFHGTYDPTVFSAQYANGFEVAEEREGFAVFVSADDADNMAYAVSEETLIVAMSPGEDEEYQTENLVNTALDRNIEEVSRVVDTDDGQWLFETTGQAPMVFGVWETEDLTATLDTDSGGGANETDSNSSVDSEAANESGNNTTDTASAVDENPVFDPVESLVNNISFTVSDGEMRDLELRFSGIYPQGMSPSEAEVREHLIGEEDMPHEISINGRRVRVIATLDEEPIN